MKKRKEEILHNKEQFTLQFVEQSTVQPSVHSTEQPSLHTTVQSNYVYGVCVLAVVAIGVCVIFSYNTFQPKNKKQD